MKNKKIKQSDSDTTISITNVIKENYAWFIAVITFLGVIVLNIFRFYEYIKCSFHFNYFGLDKNLYQYYDQNIFYSLFISIVLGLVLVSVLLSFKQLWDNFKVKKVFCKQNFNNLSIIFCSNFFLVLVYLSDGDFCSLLIGFIAIIFLEFILSWIMFYKNIELDDDSSLKDLLIDFLKKVPLIIIIVIISISLKCYTNLTLRKDYRVIDDNKVIVYSNNDYFLTLDCVVKGDTLIIYKGTQEKINNNDVYSKLIKFKNVELKQFNMCCE